MLRDIQTTFNLFFVLILTVLTTSLFSQSSIADLKNKLSGASGGNKASIELKLASKLLRSNINEAKQYADDALSISKQLNNDQLLSYSNLVCAQVYFKKKDLTKAETYSNNAIKLFSKLNDNNNYTTALSLNADILIRLKLYNKASSKFSKLYDLYIKKNAFSDAGYAALKNGICFENLKNFEKSITWYKKSIDNYNKANKTKKSVDAQVNLAIVYNNYGNYKLAEKEFNEALKKAQQINYSTKVKVINNSLSILAKNKTAKTTTKSGFDIAQEEKKNDYINAMENQTIKSLQEIEKLSAKNQLVELKIKAQHDDYEKKILNEKLAVLNADKKLQTAKAQKEKIKLELNNEKLKSEQAAIKNQRLIIIVLALAVLIVFVIIGLVYIKKNNNRLAHKNKQITSQKKVIEMKNNRINESITYARRIQKSLLHNKNMLTDAFPDSFIYLTPKDKVSGDFVWLNKSDNGLWVCAADCTGHGVPGAFISIIMNNILDNVVNLKEVKTPNQVLESASNYLKDKVIRENQMNTDFKEGMDASLIYINRDTNTLYYSGAKNPLYIIRDGEINIFKAAKRSVDINESTKPFELKDFPLNKGDMIYMFSDGFPDQKGGEKNEKFYYPPFREFLTSISNLDARKQKETINEKFNSWKKYQEQIDDVLIIGIKYS